MGGYLILIAFAVVFVAVLIHVLRTPRMPARRAFDSDENTLIGESTKQRLFLRDPGAG
jgi:cbb3-type cytochrome oxidase subunit 3